MALTHTGQEGTDRAREGNVKQRRAKEKKKEEGNEKGRQSKSKERKGIGTATEGTVKKKEHNAKA